LTSTRSSAASSLASVNGFSSVEPRPIH
jgi:hypothetical protein